ncbi:MAG: putative transcriptional regulator [Gammaproteobacteria bacterium]|jgi:predicted DNA-binding transcriptional regulator AlpA|nr:putative transcriptional regulator [Gammaproteobacteria bacterium]
MMQNTQNNTYQELQATTSLQYGLYIHQEGTKEPVFLPDPAYLRLPQILQLIPVKKSTWWAGVKSGRFPTGSKIGQNTTVWRVGAIRKLLNEISN